MAKQDLLNLMRRWGSSSELAPQILQRVRSSSALGATADRSFGAQSKCDATERNRARRQIRSQSSAAAGAESAKS